MSDVSAGYVRAGANARIRDGHKAGTGMAVFKGDHDMIVEELTDGRFTSIPTYPEGIPQMSVMLDLSPTDLGPPKVKPVEMARQQGYTGNECATCHSLRMRVAGHCEVCEDCGNSSGCS